MTTLKLTDVLRSYEQYLTVHQPEKAISMLRQLRTALDRFTLPGWGFPPFVSGRPTNAEQTAAQQFKQTVALEQLKHALEAQKVGFALLQASADSQTVYKSILKKFLDWADHQNWCVDQDKEDGGIKKIRRGHGTVTAKRLTTRKKLEPYYLTFREMPPPLQQELENFYRFWTEPVWANRVPTAIRPRTAKDYQDWLRALFGWLYRYQGKSPEQLSLSVLVPVVALKDVQDKEGATKAMKCAGKQVKALGSKFIQWLEAPSPQGREIQSPDTKIKVWVTLLALVKYQYNAQTDALLQGDSYKDILLVESLCSEMRDLQAEVDAHESISDEAQWWLNWEQVLDVTEALRQECVSFYSYPDPTRPSVIKRSSRPATAIAGSFQLYILFAMLTYIPPRRIDELQKLKVGRRENPSFDPQHPYLYQEDGMWLIDMPALAYKTGGAHGHQTLKLPNLIFKDGRSFYGDLKEWLDTWRQVYQPQHNFVFSTKHGAPLRGGRASGLVVTAMHRLTGKVVRPHKFRDICATYFLDHEYSDAIINALAEMMAHDPKTLKKSYDKRKGWQINRPIEQAAATVLAQVLKGKAS